jgi:hypothetical protein
MEGLMISTRGSRRRERRRLSLAWAVLVVAVVIIGSCDSDKNGQDDNAAEVDYDNALLVHDVDFMSRLLNEGRLGPPAEALAQMEAVIHEPANIRIDKVTREKKVNRFFTADGKLLSAEDILKADEQDGGNRREAFRAWLISPPVQAVLGRELADARQSFRREWVRTHRKQE